MGFLFWLQGLGPNRTSWGHRWKQPGAVCKRMFTWQLCCLGRTSGPAECGRALVPQPWKQSQRLLGLFSCLWPSLESGTRKNLFFAKVTVFGRQDHAHPASCKEAGEHGCSRALPWSLSVLSDTDRRAATKNKHYKNLFLGFLLLLGYETDFVLWRLPYSKHS